MLVSALVVSTLASAGLVAGHGPRRTNNHAAAARRMRDAQPDVIRRDAQPESAEPAGRLAPYLAKRGETFRGRGTWYDVEELVCACGDWHKNHEYVVAMSE